MGSEFGIFPVAVNVYLGGYDGAASDVFPFRHRSGWLRVSEARMVMPFGTWRRPLVGAISDQGEVFSPRLALLLLESPMSLPKDAECDAPDLLDEVMDRLYWDFLGSMDLENLQYLEEEQGRSDERIGALERQCATIEAELWAQVRALRMERRQNSLPASRRDWINARLERLLELPDKLALGMRQHTAGIRRETEALERAVLSSLTDKGEIESLFTLHWTARSHRRGMAIRLPVFQEEPYSADAWRNREESRNRDESTAVLSDEEFWAIRYAGRE